jgi:pentatricopeptide repeat protein
MKRTRVAATLAGDALALRQAPPPAREQGQLSNSRREPADGPLDRLGGIGGGAPRPSAPEQQTGQRPRLGLKSLAGARGPSQATRAPVAGGLPAPLTRGEGIDAPGLRIRRASEPRSAPPPDADNRSNALVIAQYKAGKRAPEEVLKVTASLLKTGGDFTTTMKLFRAVQEAGIRPGVITYNAAISACDKAGRAGEALDLFAELCDLAKHDPSMRPHVVTYNAAMAALGNAGRPDDALRLLGELKHLAVRDTSMRPTLISYTAAISACAKGGRATEALTLLAEVKQRAAGDPAMSPNKITYNATIAACANAGLADRALEMLRELKQLPMGPDVVSYGAAISACEKGGRSDEVIRLFGELKDLARRDPSMRPTAIAYSAALSAYGKAGLASEAVALLDEMKNLRMRPNLALYSATISACGRAGRVDDVLRLLNDMKEAMQEDASMAPDLGVYNAAIIACGKAGRLDDAQALFDAVGRLGHGDSALRADLVTYSAMISAYASSNHAAQVRALIDRAITEEVFQPHAGYDASTNTLDFHANRVCVNPPPSERPKGVAAGLAVSLLRYHRDMGHIDGSTKYIVGHQGNNAVKLAVLEELNRVRPDAYRVAPHNPGLLVAA